jgi:hypothetical protein
MTLSSQHTGPTAPLATPSSLPLPAGEHRRAVAATFILLGFGLAVRLAVLAVLHAVTGGSEINDDYHLYEAMIRHPLMLVSGHGFEALGDGGIYAPLVPLHLWFPGKFLGDWLGPVLGRRLGMLAYDMAALAIALRVAFRVAGPPRGWKSWCAAGLLAMLPASVGASVVWGQEDTAAALWSAAALACFVCAGPLPAMLVAGAGLFTSKLFFVVLMLGIWLAAPDGQRRRLAIAGLGCVAAFGLFLWVRWMSSGFLYPDYHYNAMSNSPSVWALYYLLVEQLPVDDLIRPYVKLLAATAMLAFVLVAWRQRRRREAPTPWSAVVAAHCAFFASFIGIHPEHYQWFLPFLIVFAWDAFHRRRRLAFALAVGITYLAYAYKVVYGLRAPYGNPAGGKQAIRDLFERYAGFDLYWVQLALVFLTLGWLLLLMWQALKLGPRSTTA